MNGQLCNFGSFSRFVGFNSTNLPGIRMISSGSNFVLILTESGDLYGCGGNQKGQLGFGPGLLNQNILLPTKITFPNGLTGPISDISAGRLHSIGFISQDEAIFSMGDNQFGQLGTGFFLDQDRPTKLPVTIKSIVKLGQGTYDHSYLVTKGKEFYSWGRNNQGQLGQGDLLVRSSPTKIPDKTPLDSLDTTTFLLGGAESTIVYASCPGEKVFGLECSCKNTKSATKSLITGCSLPSCSVSGMMDLDPRLSSPNVKMSVFLPTFTSNVVSYNVSGVSSTCNVSPTQCSFYSCTNIGNADLRSGMLTIDAKPKFNDYSNCSNDPLFFSVNTQLDFIPCWNIPSFYFRGEDFTDYLEKVSFNNFGTNIRHYGRKGNALVFDHRLARIEANINFTSSGYFGVSFFTSANINQGNQTILSYSFNRSIEFAITAEPLMRIYLKSMVISTNVSFGTDNDYHQYIVIFEESTGIISIYKDKMFQQSFNLGKMTINSGGILTIGQFYNNGLFPRYKRDWNWKSDIDELKIYTSSLLIDDIETNFDDSNLFTLWDSNGLNNDNNLPIFYDIITNNSSGVLSFSFQNSLNSFIEVPFTNPKQFIFNEFTISFKFNATSNGSLISYSTTWDINSICIELIGNLIIVSMEGSTWNTQLAIIPGQNYQLGLNWKSSTGQMNLYLDGILRSQFIIEKNFIFKAGGRLLLGRKMKINEEHTAYFVGTISDIKLYNYALDQSTCFGVSSLDPNVCSGNGLCLNSNCSCYTGWTGASCNQTFTCNLVASTNIASCFGNGICSGNETCTCNPESYGNLCQLSGNILWDMMGSLCLTPQCSLDVIYLQDCILGQGPSCYCNMTYQNVTIGCDLQNKVIQISIISSGLSGTLMDLRNLTFLQSLDLSNNVGIILSNYSSIFPKSIVNLKLDGIGSTVHSSLLDFDSTYSNLRNISLGFNSICGAYPASWLSKNVNLVGHSKTLLCPPSISSTACYTIPLAEEFIVYNVQSLNLINITLVTNNTSCEQLNIGNILCTYEFGLFKNYTSPTSFINGVASCDRSLLPNILRSTVYLSHRSQQIRITNSIPLYRITPGFLDLVNGTKAINYQTSLNFTVVFENLFPIEAHKNLYCVILPYGNNYQNTINIFNQTFGNVTGTDLLKSCSLNINQPLSSSNLLVDLYYKDSTTEFWVNNFPGIFNLIIPSSLQANSLIGLTNQPKKINLIPQTVIERNLYHDLKISVNNTLLDPDLPIIYENSGIVVFEAEEFYKLTISKGRFFFVNQDPNTDASGGSFIKALGIDPSFISFGYTSGMGELTYRINFTNTGNYQLFSKSLSFQRQNTGFHFTINKVESLGGFGASVAFVPYNNTPNSVKFAWNGTLLSGLPTNFTIPSPGIYELGLYVRDQTPCLDQFYLTKAGAPNGFVSNSPREFWTALNTTINPSVSSLIPLTVFWRNGITLDTIQMTNQTLFYAAIQFMNLISISPLGMLNNVPTLITISTNTPIMNYGNLVLFYCSVGGSIFIATPNSNNFTCLISSNFTNSLSTNISILAIHQTNGEQLIVSDSIAFQFLQPFTWVYHSPFIVNQTNSFNLINITSDVDLYTDFSRIFCYYRSSSLGNSFIKANYMSARTASCMIQRPTLYSHTNIDYSYVGMVFNASTSIQTLYLNYSTQIDNTHLTIEEPISYVSLSQVFRPNSFGSTFTANITALIVPQTISFSMITYYPSTVETNIPFTIVNRTAQLTMPTLNPSFIPQVYYIKLKATWGPITYESLSNTFYFKKQTVALYETNFLSEVFNQTQTSVVVRLQSQNFNPQFSYFCIDGRDNSSIPGEIMANTAEIRCNLTQRGIEETFYLDVAVNTAISGLKSISFLSEPKITFTKLLVSPNYILKGQISNFLILYNQNQNYTFLTKYRTSSTISLNTLGCTITTTDTICGPLNQFESFGMYALNGSLSVTLSGNIISSARLQKPLLIYSLSDHETTSFTALIGSKSNVEFVWSNNPLNIDRNRVSNLNFFINILESNSSFNCSIKDTNTLECDIYFTGFNTINMRPFFTAPDITSNSLLPLSNIYTSFNFLTPGFLTFSNQTQVKFFFTQQNTPPIFLNFNSTFPDSINSNIRCAINNRANGFTVQTVILSKSNTTTTFRCIISATIPGLADLSLWHIASKSTFKVSTNDLQIVFVSKTSVNSFVPSVGVYQKLTNLQISTDFQDVNYGSSTYECLFQGSNENIRTNATMSKSQFLCDLTFGYTGNYQLSIFMNYTGTSLMILQNTEQYTVLDSLFLTPSYGTVYGNEIVYVYNYTGTSPNITFKNYPSILFNCRSFATNLTCLTPNIAKILPSFFAYDVSMSNASIQLPFVEYEPVTITSMFPQVVPNDLTTFPTQLTLNQTTNTTEGSLNLVIGFGTGQVQRYDLGSQNQTLISVSSALVLLPRTYPVAIFYKNSKLIEVAQSIQISNNQNLTFIDVSGSLNFEIGATNIGRVNTSFVVSITHTPPLSSEFRPFVVCSLNNTSLPTVVTASGYNCTVNSRNIGMTSLTLYYVKNDTLSGQFLLVKSPLPIIIYDEINVQSISPQVTTVTNALTVSITSNYTNLFGSNIYYMCERENFFSNATLANQTFSCLLSSDQFAPTRNVSVSLWIFTVQTNKGFRLSGNTLPFYFYAPNTLLYNLPFATSRTTNISVIYNVTVGVQNQLPFDNSLICSYKLSNGEFKTTQAKTNGFNNVTCIIQQDYFYSNDDVIQIWLAISINQGVLNIIPDTNFGTLVTFLAPLSFNISTPITSNNFNLAYILSIKLPTIIQFSYELYGINISPNPYENTKINCTYLQGTNPLCQFLPNQFNPLYQPAEYSFTLFITHPYKDIESFKAQLFVNKLIYYSTISMNTYPYMFSYKESNSKQLNYFIEFTQLINSKFIFYCETTNGPFNATIQGNQTLKCPIQSNKVQSITVNSTFTDPSLNFTKYLISSTSTIQMVDQIPISKTQGGYLGGSKIDINLPSLSFSLAYSYNFSMRFMEKGVLRSCSCTLNLNILSCTTPSVYSPFSTQMMLYINNEFSMTLPPTFFFRDYPIITGVSPNRFLRVSQGASYNLTTLYPMNNIPSIPIYVKLYKPAWSQTYQCSVNSISTINCFFLSTYSNGGDLAIQVSLDQDLFYDKHPVTLEQNVDLYLYQTIPSSFTFYPGEIFPNTFQIEKTTSVSIHSASDLIYYQTRNVAPIYKIYDTYITEYVYGSLNRSYYSFTFPSLLSYNVPFPRNLSIDITIDGVYWFTFPSKVQVLSFDYDIQMSPTAHPLSQSINITFTNAPSIFLYSGERITGIFYVETASPLQIYSSNPRMVIDCGTSLKFCTTKTVTGNKNTYRLAFFAENSTNVRQLFIPNILYMRTFLNNNIPTLTSTIIKRKMETMIGISGGISFLELGSSIKIFSLIDTYMLNATNIIIYSDSYLEFLFPPIPTSIKLPKQRSIIYSLNNFTTNKVVLNTATFIDEFSINNVDPPFIYNFKPTTLTISAFYTNATCDLRIRSNMIQGTYQTKIKNGTTSWQAPQLWYNSIYPLVYPIPIFLGLSCNGLDWSEYPLSYTDKYKNILIFSISPKIIHQGFSYSMNIQGIGLDTAQVCNFYDSVTRVSRLNTTVISLNQTNNVICPLTNPQSSLKLSIVNTLGDKSDLSSEIINLPPIIIYNFSPKISSSVGNIFVIINGQNFQKDYEIYCQLGSVDCPKTCQYIDSSNINCTIPPVPPGSSNIKLTYNKINYFINPQLSFNFTDCGIGYTASNYLQECKPCPKGTYKPTSGFYECFNCSLGTYTDQSGSSSCRTCPQNTTTTILGSSSIEFCKCQKTLFLTNPYFNRSKINDTQCIPCPIGAICPQIGTIIPDAAPGYWFTKDNILEFWKCVPALACPGGPPENCTLGYYSQRCSQCYDNWYKEKLICQPCQPGAIWKLIALVILIVIVLIVFFLITSVKLHHINSLSIGMSFWQIISLFSKLDIQWPWTVDATLSTASVSQFNFDFLSPTCVVPWFKFIYQYFLSISLPALVLIGLVLLFIVGYLRNVFAKLLGHKIAHQFGWKYKSNYEKEKEEDNSYEMKKTKNFKEKLSSFLITVKYGILNLLIYIHNLLLWCIKERLNTAEMKVFIAKLINCYLSFVSFFFIRIITTASEIFVCTSQPNGTSTLNQSPDIICFRDIWWALMPISVITFIIFGLGSLIYFTVIILRFHKWKNNIMFLYSNMFTLERFKTKYFFWEGVITLRKMAISVLQIFFRPLFVIVLGIAITFIGMILHMHFIPYKKKFQ